MPSPRPDSSTQMSNALRPNSPFALPVTRVMFVVSLILYSAFPEDLERLRVISFAGIQIYVVDLIYFCLLVVAIRMVLVGRQLMSDHLSKLYLLFLSWLFAGVVIGLFKFGYRSLGESRYVLSFVGFFLPIALVVHGDSNSEARILSLIRTTIIVCGLTAFVMFWVEVIHGGRLFLSPDNQSAFGSMEDFRGTRYLGSAQTFSIMSLAAFLTIQMLVTRTFSARRATFSLLLVAVSVSTKNRAALFSIVAAFTLLLVLRKDFRKFIYIIATVLLAGTAIATFFPGPFDNVRLAIVSGLSPTEDETGIWRMTLNGAALEQGMETPIVGQGFGGYFHFEVPGMAPIEEPPHNQFIYLFLKTGSVGAFLCLSLLISFFWQSKRGLQSSTSIESEIAFSWLLVFSASQFVYGLVYGFIPLFGLFLGCAATMKRRDPAPMITREARSNWSA